MISDDDLFADVVDTPQLRAALDCASRGWHVFPCGPDKQPLTKHGFKDASCDPDAVRSLWEKWPHASVGVATGASGLVVIDLDVKKGKPGLDEWHRIKGEIGEHIERTTLVETPSGGMHVYYRANGHKVGSTTERIAPGVDTRAEGGYVIASGSPGYLYVDEHGPEQLATMPDELAKLVSYGQEKPAAKQAGTIPEGRRNSALASLAGTMRRRGLSEDAIYAALAAENKQSCKPPLPDADVRRIAGSIGRYEPSRPVQTQPPEPPEEEPAPEKEKPGLTCHTITDLRERQPEILDWICYPYIAEGDVVSFESPPKDGKTTFVLGMVHSVATGGRFLGEKTCGGPVLYCTEERVGTFLGALERTQNNEGDVRIVLIHECAWNMKWAETAAEIARLAAEVKAKLVVVDTLSKWAGLSGDDEFSAGVAMATMTPLQHLASTGLGVAVIRHERKAGGSVGKAGRGSTAWTGEMDTVIAVRRIPEEKTRRLVCAIGRHDETPDERIVDFSSSEYQMLGDPVDLRRLDEEKQIIDSLNYGEAGALPINELRGDVKRRTAERILGRLLREGIVKRGQMAGPRGSHSYGYWLQGDE